MRKSRYKTLLPQVVVAFFVSSFSIITNAQIVVNSFTPPSKYDLDEGPLLGIEHLSVDSIVIDIDYLTNRFAISENSDGLSNEVVLKIASYYSLNKGIHFSLDTNRYNICSATINYERTQFTMCLNSDENVYLANNYQGNGIKIREFNNDYKEVYEAEYEKTEIASNDIALLEGRWLKIEKGDSMEVEFIFDEVAFNLGSICNDSVKTQFSGTQRYHVKGFGIKKRSFEVCYRNKSYVLLTLRDGCFAEEWLIRRLTSTEVIVFTGVSVLRLVKI
jgi:hypothetical protein